MLSLLILAIQVLQLLIIVRIVLSYFPGAQYSSAGRVLSAVVDPVLAPFRRILPTFGGIDFSPMLAILVLYALSQVLEGLQFGSLSISGALAFIVARLVLGIIVFFCVLILIRILLGLLHASPFHPLVLFVREVTTPLVRPFSGLVPRSRGLELDAVIAFVAYLALLLAAQVVLTRLVG